MKRIFFYLFIFVLMAGCAKEASNEFVAYPGNPQNDTSWHASISGDAAVNTLLSLLSSPPVSDSFDISVGGVLHLGGNADIIFPAGCTKEAVSGKIKVEGSYLRAKGDMVRFGKPTVSNNYMLISDGAFYINMSKDSQVLHGSDDARISLKYPSKMMDRGMKLFYGDTSVNATDGFTWVPVTDSSNINFWQNGDVAGYTMFPRNLGWINCDKFADSTVASTKLNVVLPLNFTNTNTAVFIVFKDQWSVLRMSADIANRYFYSRRVPLQKKIMLVSLSKIGDDLYLGSKETIVTADAIEELKPIKVSKQNILDFLAAL